jgi:capsule polysaccharide export protein KpsC/LpsZ
MTCPLSLTLDDDSLFFDAVVVTDDEEAAATDVKNLDVIRLMLLLTMGLVLCGSK